MIKTKRYPKLMKIQMRIKKGYPGQGQEDKQMIKKMLKKDIQNRGKIRGG